MLYPTGDCVKRRSLPAYPALNAFVQCFASIRHVQTAMEAIDKPTTFVLLTIFYVLLEKLRDLSARTETQFLEVLHPLTHVFAKECLGVIAD